MSVVEMLKTYQEGMIWIGLMLGLTERQLLMMSTVEMVAAIRETMGEHMDRFGQLEANEQRALALLDAFEAGPPAGEVSGTFRQGCGGAYDPFGQVEAVI